MCKCLVGSNPFRSVLAFFTVRRTRDGDFRLMGEVNHDQDCEFGVKFRVYFLVGFSPYSRIMILCNEWDFPIEIADVGSDFGGQFLVGFMAHSRIIIVSNE